MSEGQAVPRVARVTLPDGTRTHTLLGADRLPVPVVEDFLDHLRAVEVSPHTVQAYARGLAAWWQLLADRGDDWTAPTIAALSDLVRYLRTGDLPSVARVGAPPGWLAPRSVAQRYAAVAAFYDWADAEHGVRLPRRSARHLTGGRYQPMTTGVGPRKPAARRAIRLRQVAAQRPPVLSPQQVQLIITAAGTPTSGQFDDVRALRDRLLFAMLPETGLRLGEALSLRHCDWHVGGGDTPFLDVVPRQDHPHGCRVKNSRPRRLFVSDELERLYSGYVWALVDAAIDVDVENLSEHWVFVNTHASSRWTPMRPETVYQRVRAIMAANPADLPEHWSPHWMRHTHATALLLSGCPEHVVMRRLGHADVQTTLNTYGWVTDDAQMRTLAGWRKFATGWTETPT